jgi:hypothetical protein
VRIALVALIMAGAVSGTIATVLLWMILTRPTSLLELVARLPMQ